MMLDLAESDYLYLNYLGRRGIRTTRVFLSI